MKLCPESLFVEMDGDKNGRGNGGGSSKAKAAIIVILVGAPGSGKTTFCNNVMKSALRPWVRVCQDSIANGKAGTKAQCIKATTDALKDGKSVFIDRCNLDREQRAEFLKLGGPEVDVHAMVLDLPGQLCISRSVKRTGHEGNLQGGRAAAVVNRMLQKKEMPKLSEGFSRITFCQNESDVQSAVNTFSMLGPLDSLLPGCFGQKCTDSKVQLGIMKFLKKVDGPDNIIADNNSLHDSVSEKGNVGKEPEKFVSSLGDGDGTDIKSKGSMVDASIGDLPINDGIDTLAFPSISTSDFQFNHEKASDIIVEKVAEFLNKVENVRLVLVDLSKGSKILSMVGTKAAQKNIDSKKFFTFVGDITRLYTGGGLHCNVIANAANWRLRPGGGGVNAAVFTAAGEDLEVATKQHAETLSPGSSVAVPLPPSSPLCIKEGVTHVIHVLGPNMNPQRPNYLKNNYVKGCKILHEAYSSLFESFASIMKADKSQKKDGQITGFRSSESHKNSLDRNHIEQKAKREGCYKSDRNKKCKGFSSRLSSEKDESFMQSDTTERKVEQKKGNIYGGSKVWGSWAQALHQIAMYPEQHKNNVIEMSDHVVVINDLYPKAKNHLLVLARKNGLDSLADVHSEHVQLLRNMHSVGLKWAEQFLNADASMIFRVGYHSVPSMRQLHLHVISQDFDSPHLKNKKHWNSFNTIFFCDSVDVIEEVDKYGKPMLNEDESLLSMELRCHRCRSAHPNIPRLKSHISNCRAPFPANLLQNGRLVLSPARAGKQG